MAKICCLVFYDAHDTRLFTIKINSYRLPLFFHLENLGKERCVEVKPKYSWKKLHVEISFTTVAERKVVLTLRGRSAMNDVLDIKCEEDEVATVYKKPGKELESGKRSEKYEAKMKAGADAALAGFDAGVAAGGDGNGDSAGGRREESSRS
ncbi:hypothetical protein AJ80_06016 [Polytolypa hystricis UAMH7299]|uniref:Uncharacterized protein n=1 Tax=Polytolypa hystricis (strain UAMH7299) TaxID=1447883 RepID=A0A2B7XZ06_POLH7|nr:hypothetical protein AJ80_06016 [Polytolypa hystricis UAMH7299]